MNNIILEYISTENDSNLEIGKLLRNKFKISSRLLTKLKMNEKILVNGVPVFSNHIVKACDNIKVKIDFEEEDNIVPQEMNLDILYEDEYLLIVNKPAGMVVHPSSYHPNNTLANGIKFYLNNKKKIRPINRLDRDTSGIVMFAKNEYIQELMITEKNIKKEYIAIVEGVMTSTEGTIDKPIARKNGSIMEREINEKGQIAITHYNVIKIDKEKNLSLIHLILETGRTHQIRVHLSSIGHSILGDTLYGNASNLISRQALHAQKISFTHPITHGETIVEANLPLDMKNIM